MLTIANASDVSFLDGVLMFEGFSGAIRIQSWPPKAWKKNPLDPEWHECHVAISTSQLESKSKETVWNNHAGINDKDNNGLLPYRTDKAIALGQFLEQIPRAVRNVVSEFQGRNFDLLQYFFQTGDAGLELAFSSPAVALGLACSPQFAGTPGAWDKIRSLLVKPQRKQVSALGFPPAQRSVAALRRLSPRYPFHIQVLLLRRLLWQAEQDERIKKALYYLPSLNHSILRVLASEISRLIT